MAHLGATFRADIGNDFIPAINELAGRDQWVAWKLLTRPGAAKPTKPPVNPHTGGLASHSDPRTWSSYARAEARAKRDSLAGVGFVLTEDDDYTGIDLDKCRDPATGQIEPWAQAILDLAETYAEVSPSGTGIRMIARGKIEKTVKSDVAHVEIYVSQRYLTITEQHIDGTPNEIREAPNTLAALIARAESMRPKREEPPRSQTSFKPSTPSASVTAGHRAWAAKALESHVNELAATLEGGRDNELVRRAFMMGQIIARGWIDEATVRASLEDACRANGLFKEAGAKAIRDKISARFVAARSSPHEDLPESEYGPDAKAEAIGKRAFEAFEQSDRRREAEAAGADPETGEIPEGGEQPNARSGKHGASKSFDWTEPRQLPSGKIPVPAFDPFFLPASLRDWANDISDRLQCPLDFVGVSMFVAMGSLIGRKVAVRPQRNTPWAEVPNIWGCIVGDPGVFKSPAMKEALAPINKLEAEAIEKNNEALEQFKREEHLYALKVKAADRTAAKLKPDEITSDLLPGDPPAPPQLQRYVYGDTTYEALALGLLHNPNGVLAFRDELISLLKRLEDDRYANERGFYLSAWNGDGTYALDRKISGHSAIKGACLSILGSTQPGRIADFVSASQGAGDDGLLQRFSLMVWPDLNQNWSDIDRAPNYEGRRTAFRTFERLAHLDPEEIGAEPCELGGLPFLRFSDEAREEFLAWREPFEARVRGSELSPALRSYLAKHRKLVPTIALISHLADGGRGPIQKEHLLRALAVAEYAEAHAMRCYSAGVISHVLAAQAIVRRIKRGDVVNGVTARDIHQQGWSHLTNRTVVGEALDLLVDHGWLAQRQETTGGRPTTKYYINPAVPR